MANPNPSPRTRFRAGRSGNPKGRPAGPSLGRIVRGFLERVDPATGSTYAELLCERLLL